MACALLPNLILQNMAEDPLAGEDGMMQDNMEILEGENDEPEFITHISTSNEWTNFRNTLSQGMYNSYRARGH